jgi:Flp pilus assembly pilin Flp
MGFLRRDEDGGTLVEYALVAPLLMTLIVGAIDLSYMLFQWQGAVKATQIGARLAIVMDRAAPGLASFDGSGNAAIGLSCMGADGLPIAACNFGTVTCTSKNGCTCVGAHCAGIGGAPGPTFTTILKQMQIVLPQLAATNLQIKYTANGFGYVGFPASANVTVSIVGLKYQFFALSAFETVFPASMSIPASSATLASEDLKSS